MVNPTMLWSRVAAFLIGLILLAWPVVAAAQSAPDELKDVLPAPGTIKNLPTRFYSLSSIVATIFNIVITISGAIFMVLLLIGGIQYMTAAGNEENTTKAKKLLVDAVIGLVLTLSAWAIGTFILSRFYGPGGGALLPGGSSASGRPVGGGGGPGTGSSTTAQTNAAFNAGFDDGQRSFTSANNDPNAACDKSNNANYQPGRVADNLQGEYEAGFDTGCSNSGTRR